MKKVIKKIIGLTTTLAISFIFVLSVYALSGSSASRSWYINTNVTLTSSGSMTKSYKTTITATNGSGSNSMETKIRLAVLWYYNDYASNYSTISAAGTYNTYWTANSNNKTQFYWEKYGGSGTLTASTSYTDI